MKAKSMRPQRGSAEHWRLYLYIAGQTAKSMKAFENLKTFCECHLKGCYHITVVDLVEQPQLARDAQILAIPTVVRELPKPVRTLIGNFSDTERVLDGLDLSATA